MKDSPDTLIVKEPQLIEHLSEADVEDVLSKGNWDNAILPRSLSGSPIKLERVPGGFKVTYGTMAELDPHKHNWKPYGGKT